MTAHLEENSLFDTKEILEISWQLSQRKLIPMTQIKQETKAQLQTPVFSVKGTTNLIRAKDFVRILISRAIFNLGFVSLIFLIFSFHSLTCSIDKTHSKMLEMALKRLQYFFKFPRTIPLTFLLSLITWPLYYIEVFVLIFSNSAGCSYCSYTLAHSATKFVIIVNVW